MLCVLQDDSLRDPRWTALLAQEPSPRSELRTSPGPADTDLKEKNRFPAVCTHIEVHAICLSVNACCAHAS